MTLVNAETFIASHEGAAKRSRPRSVNGVLSEWPKALDAVYKDPTSTNLDSLCSLLDAMDGDICRRWNEKGHAARLEALSECRAAARLANAHIALVANEKAQARGLASAAAKRERSAA
jgi:hypothetical protein